ncbi:probable WRKY transcription factor 26 [Durio zibethinus]|uniref:Probable WRKY transcription factor 26 n=1 Tax=Durio zibethinus TaxID=66656 RepID=A0A6P5ZSG0_DURZI|nr:probable WRKY transcription factor 26 [Durio zibethinus]
MSESPPPCIGGTPLSEVYDCDFKEQELKDDSKKRKIVSRLKELIRVTHGTRVKGPPDDDGFSWRKFGLKEILGSKYPRTIGKSRPRNLFCMFHVLESISMLNCNTSLVAKPQPSEQAIRMPESQPPRVGSTPRSEVHDCDFEEQELKDDSKERKTLLRLAELIRVPSTSLEVSPDDGFSWRKYEQKEILGSKYPRSYYWCISGNAQGCLAQKQVQRSDDNPTIFEMTYHGRHTCTLGSHVVPFLGPLENQDQETFYASPKISGITYCSTSPSPSPSGMNPIMQEDIDF